MVFSFENLDKPLHVLKLDKYISKFDFINSNLLIILDVKNI